MNISDILAQSGALDTISRQLGIDSSVARTGAEALLPAILGGFQKQAQGGGSGVSGGFADVLGGVLSGGGAPSTEAGNDILGQIFGSKDVSRTVAGHASSGTGIDPALLKKMLPLLAMAVTGYLASRGNTQASGGSEGGGGLLGQVLGSVLGGGQSGSGKSGGLGGLASLIDLNGNGNPLDDILGMAAKFGGR